MTAGFVRQAVGRAIPAAALGEARAEATRSGIAEVGRMLLGLPEAVRVKVFDGEGTVLWSDEPRLIGSNFGRDRRVQQSLTGSEVVALERIGPTREHPYEFGRHRELTAVYGPHPRRRDRQGRHGVRAVHAFLSSARPLELTLGGARVGDIVHGALDSLRSWLSAAGVTVHEEVREPLPEVRCDRARVEHALQELVGNGVESGARTVWVRAHPSAGGAHAVLCAGTAWPRPGTSATAG